MCELFVLIGDSNPEYTPDEFFEFFESENDAIAHRLQTPGVFRKRIYRIMCPICNMRNNKDEAWKKKYVCGFSDWLDNEYIQRNKFNVWTFSSLPLYIGQRGQTLNSSNKTNMLFIDSKEHDFECPRCFLAK